LLFILIANEFMEFTEDLEAFLFPEAWKNTVSGNVAMKLCTENID
jgi:hypothetical protein